MAEPEDLEKERVKVLEVPLAEPTERRVGRVLVRGSHRKARSSKVARATLREEGIPVQ